MDRNDLISRSELKKVIETYRSNECFNDFQRGKNKMVDCCIAEIDNAPTINTYTKGEWKSIGYGYFCSICHNYHENSNFCPNCGAKMKGGAE